MGAVNVKSVEAPSRKEAQVTGCDDEVPLSAIGTSNDALRFVMIYLIFYGNLYFCLVKLGILATQILMVKSPDYHQEVQDPRLLL